MKHSKISIRFDSSSAMSNSCFISDTFCIPLTYFYMSTRSCTNSDTQSFTKKMKNLGCELTWTNLTLSIYNVKKPIWIKFVGKITPCTVTVKEVGASQDKVFGGWVVRKTYSMSTCSNIKFNIVTCGFKEFKNCL